MNKLTRTIMMFVALMVSTVAAFAQTPDGNRRQWFSEMRQLRTNFVAKELQLTSEQRAKFVPLYDEMSREVMKAQTDARKLYKSVRDKGAAATDLEKEKAAEAMFETKGKESEIEMRYFARFKTILTPDQLLKFKDAEHRFNRQLMKQHNKGRKK